MNMGTRAPALSIVIPARNAGATIGAQLEALARQPEAASCEVLLVDNESTDNTVAETERFRPLLPGLRVIDGSHRRGAASARNSGAHAATGENLAFCDADDVVGVHWIAAMIAALREHNLVTGPVIYDQLNAEWVAQSRRRAYEEDPSSAAPTAGWMPFAISANVGVSRSLFTDLGGFDETMLASEDIDFSWRAQLRGCRFHFAKDAIVHYRLRHSRRAIFKQAWFYGNWYVFLCRKHAPNGYRTERWTARHFARKWRRTFRDVFARGRTRAGRAQIIFEIGTHLGRLSGGLRYRFFVP